jgi:hypothetical protein
LGDYIIFVSYSCALLLSADISEVSSIRFVSCGWCVYCALCSTLSDLNSSHRCRLPAPRSPRSAFLHQRSVFPAHRPLFPPCRLSFPPLTVPHHPVSDPLAARFFLTHNSIFSPLQADFLVSWSPTTICASESLS